MKKNSNIVFIFVSTLIALLAFAFVYWHSFLNERNIKGEDKETPSTQTEVVTNEVLETEMISEGTEIETEEDKQMYPDVCGLDYVDPPQKRTKEEVYARLEELSETNEMVAKVCMNMDAYTSGELSHLANNPEMADFFLSYANSDGSVTGGFSEQELEEDYSLLLQFDPRWGNYIYGDAPMGFAGCGPTCMSMAILYLTDETIYTPDKIADDSVSAGYYVEGVGTAWSLMTEYPTRLGLSSYAISISDESMKQKLDEGCVLILSVSPGAFTSVGHFILIYGYDENGYFVNDPKCVARSRQTWDYDLFDDQIKQVWAIGK